MGKKDYEKGRKARILEKREGGREGRKGRTKAYMVNSSVEASSFPSHESRLPVGCMLSPLISANLPQCSSHLSLRTAWVFLGIEHRT